MVLTLGPVSSVKGHLESSQTVDTSKSYFSLDASAAKEEARRNFEEKDREMNDAKAAQSQFEM